MKQGFPPGRRGLVYDDDETCRRAVGAVLERCGFAVVGQVAAAADAIRLAQEARPHVVVLDLALSGTRGIRVISALLAAAPGCAVVVLSPFEALKNPALAAGACGFIDKNDMRHLEACLREVAGRPPAPAPLDLTSVESRPQPAAAPTSAAPAAPERSIRSGTLSTKAPSS